MRGDCNGPKVTPGDAGFVIFEGLGETGANWRVAGGWSMASLAILLLFQVIGWMVATYGHVPLPGNVLGLLLLLAALFLRVVKLEQVEPAAAFLLKHMLVLFAPIIAGTLSLGPVLAAEWGTFAAICAVATPVTLVITAWVAQVTARLERGRAAR